MGPHPSEVRIRGYRSAKALSDLERTALKPVSLASRSNNLKETLAENALGGDEGNEVPMPP
ncbi:hypothetical protein BDR03DRAFT_1015687 [Suillus americanus]|nr:hypothetical protein BDR03DRAFT_1015687 [Suillus americanus]